MKSRISYLISKKYGVYTDINDLTNLDINDYLRKKYYSNRSNKRINILISLKQSITQNRNNPILLHYLNHKNHIPPWILTTNISYGSSIEWYNILKGDDKLSICNSFIIPGLLKESETKEFVKKALDITKEYRNKIAHGNRTFNILNLPQLPKYQLRTLTHNIISEDEYNARMGQNDTLAILLSIITMFDDKYLISNFVNELHNLLRPYQDSLFNQNTIYKLLGFPDDLFSRSTKLMEQKFA